MRSRRLAPRPKEQTRRRPLIPELRAVDGGLQDNQTDEKLIAIGEWDTGFTHNLEGASRVLLQSLSLPPAHTHCSFFEQDTGPNLGELFGSAHRLHERRLSTCSRRAGGGTPGTRPGARACRARSPKVGIGTA